MTRASVRHRHNSHPQRPLGLHFRCTEDAGDAPSAEREQRPTVPRAPPTGATGTATQAKGRRVTRRVPEKPLHQHCAGARAETRHAAFISEGRGPPRRPGERPKPGQDWESKSTGLPTLPVLCVSQLSRPAWPRTNAAGREETRPASKVSGAVATLSSPSCFLDCLVIP